MPNKVPEWRVKSKDLIEVKKKTRSDVIQKIQGDRDEIFKTASYQEKVIWVEITKILGSIEKMPKTTEQLMFTCAQLSNFWNQLQRMKTDKAVVSKKLKEAENASAQ